MKTKLKLLEPGMFCAIAIGIASPVSLLAAKEEAPEAASERPKTEAKLFVSNVSGLVSREGPRPKIPWSQIGARAGADYRGDGLGISPTSEGARLRCVCQQLQGEATQEGLWLTSTVGNAPSDRFRVVATEVRRLTSPPTLKHEKPNEIQSLPTSPTDQRALPRIGAVQVTEKLVRFIRSSVIEEYSLSMDGVRQDFVVMESPSGAGELAVLLAVTGAAVEPTLGGARLRLENSGRKILYNRLHATDANGKELPARMDVQGSTNFQLLQTCATAERAQTNTTLAVVVDDSEAAYPIRIDPTFSDANWISMGGIPGTDGSVYAAAVDGSGNLYIGGSFTIVGDVLATNIAKWNGTNWSALESGMDRFGYVNALAVSGTELYAGGVFTRAGSSAATNIAKWNGSSWTALGSGIGGVGYSAVVELAVSGSDLYVGGIFTTAGGIASTNIAKWDGSIWSALGSGMNGGVYALAVSGSDLYAGGPFTTAGDVAATNIAKWNGNAWSSLDSGMDGGVRALAVSGSDLYAGGAFATAGGIAASNIAKWDGTSWSSLGSGLSGPVGFNCFVSALAVSGSDLYAGGIFWTAGGIPATNIAKWNGSNWSALSSGMDGGVVALVTSGSDLYAGGGFAVAGGIVANSIAKWNGDSWSAVASGMNNVVYAVAVSGSDVYAGGWFTTVGGSAANYIAKWDGNSWSPLGSGMNDWVQALAVSGSDLYAGGYFTNAGGIAANYISKWNGSTWSALGSGMDGQVYALAASGNDLYAGGDFTTAGGITANGIAKWDGSSWSALGSGMNGVRALAVSGSNVYAGGWFTTAGGIAANHVAKWDGSSWSALGSGVSDWVPALAASGSDVYAGGGFNSAGGVAVNAIAKWNGSTWTALGSGVGGVEYPSVRALVASGSELYVGGYFTTAGGKVSGYIARAIVNPPVLDIEGDGSGGYFIRFSGVPGSAYRLQRAPTVQGPWAGSAPQTAPASGQIEFWDLFPPPGKGFYRTVQP